MPLMAHAQAPVVLNNNGEPMRVPFACNESDLQAGGLLCTDDEPCAIYLELSAVAAQGGKLLVAGDLHATSATLASVLLSSDDAGLTWKEPTARVPGSALEHLQFLDAQHAWAAGEVQYPLARDPFFLLSTDGGSYWRQQPVTDDGGPGSVLRFWFDSPQHGELIVDAGKTAEPGRYGLYEAETGGTGWMLRSSTLQLPKLANAPASTESADFRIRASGNANRIEKRAGEKWETAASFLVETASCKTPPAELKEPPPDVTEPEKPAPDTPDLDKIPALIPQK